MSTRFSRGNGTVSIPFSTRRARTRSVPTPPLAITFIVPLDDILCSETLRGTRLLTAAHRQAPRGNSRANFRQNAHAIEHALHRAEARNMNHHRFAVGSIRARTGLPFVRLV